MADPYHPNNKQWAIGDLVIHVGDAKNYQMLMRVTGYTKEGRCLTKYHNPPAHMHKEHAQRTWENDIEDLLDPDKFPQQHFKRD